MPPARDVYQLRSGLHGGDGVCVEQSRGLGRVRQDHDHHVRLLQHPSCLRSGQNFVDPRQRLGMALRPDDAHSEGRSPPRDCMADGTESENSEGPSRQLARSEGLPLVLALLRRRLRDLLGHGQYQGEYELAHLGLVDPARIGDGDPLGKVGSGKHGVDACSDHLEQSQPVRPGPMAARWPEGQQRLGLFDARDELVIAGPDPVFTLGKR